MNAKTGGLNGLGLILGILAASERIVRSPPVAPAVTTPRQGSATLAALGLGAAFFALHTFLSDAGTIIAWSWEGWPIRGPVAIPHSALTVLAIALGLILPERDATAPASRRLFVVAAAGCATMYGQRSWQGFGGGCVLVAWLAGQLPLQLRSAMRYSPGPTLAGAWAVYSVLTVLNVIPTAYAFVPGGVHLRERTDLILIGMMALVFAGLHNARSLPPLARSRSLARTWSLAKVSVAILSVLAVATSLHRLPKTKPKPWRPLEDRVLTAGIWCVGVDRFGIDAAEDSPFRPRWSDVGESATYG